MYRQSRFLYTEAHFVALLMLCTVKIDYFLTTEAHFVALIKCVVKIDFLDTNAHLVALTKCTVKMDFCTLKLTLLL